MSSCPTIRIAMFGSRSTGKTTFLTSFVGVIPEQGCSLAVSDSDTQKYLRDGWQRLMHGDVPGATPMMIKDKLLFKLRYQVQGQQRDERAWDIAIKDYPGKLVEWDNPSDKSEFGNAWENDNQDKLSKEFKEELKKHIQKSDAILFLAPIDIQHWDAADQKLYIAYINDIINTAKESRENYSRSIPFCLALMKWDMTGINAATADINPDASYLIAPEVEAFLKENPVFQKIHTVIDNLNNDRVAVFATSAFGGHLPDDDTKPDPDHLEPYNILPILYWMCSRVEQNRLLILEREIERISLLPECHEKYEQITKTYQTVLEQGLNDTDKIKEIEQKLQENQNKHIEFAEKEIAEKFNVIEHDKRCKNPWKEKCTVLSQQLRSGLYKPENKRELEHDIADLGTKARQYVTRVWTIRGVLCLVAFVIGIGVLYGITVSGHVANYANAESVLKKGVENLTIHDYKIARGSIDVPPCFMEDSLPGVKGRRKNIEQSLKKYEDGYCKKVQTQIDSIKIVDEAVDEDKITGLKQKIAIIDKLDPKTTPTVVCKHFESQKEMLTTQVQMLQAGIDYNNKVEELVKFTSTIQGLDSTRVLIEIANSPFKRGDFKSSESQYFDTIDNLRKETEQTLVGQLEEEIAKIQHDVEEYQFSEKIKIAKVEYEVYLKYSQYFPEKHDLRVKYSKLATERNDIATKLEKYLPLEKSFAVFRAPTTENRLSLAEQFKKTYSRTEYELAGKLFDEVDVIIAEGKDELFRSYTDELAQYKDNTLDSLSKRIDNCNKRDKVCNEYLDKFATDPKKQELIQNEQKDISNLLKELTEWKTFDDAYTELDKEDKVAMQGFVDKYRNNSVCNRYPKFAEMIKTVDETIKVLEEKEQIDSLHKEFQEFEKEYANNKTNYQSNQESIASLINKLRKFEKDSDIASDIAKLESWEQENYKAWEDSEYSKVQNALSQWDFNHCQSTLSNAITVASEYLNNTAAPRQHSTSVSSDLSKLQDINRIRTINISVTGHNIWNTNVNNSIRFNKLRYTI